MKDGLRSSCKECQSLYRKDYNTRRSHVAKEYWEKNKERRRDHNRNTKYKARYGITLAQAEELYSRGCEICGSLHQLNIDHCHTTGKVRGCLCNKCNTRLGFLEKYLKNPQLLAKDSNYILRGES